MANKLEEKRIAILNLTMKILGNSQIDVLNASKDDRIKYYLMALSYAEEFWGVAEKYLESVK